MSVTRYKTFHPVAAEAHNELINQIGKRATMFLAVIEPLLMFGKRLAVQDGEADCIETKTWVKRIG